MAIIVYGEKRTGLKEQVILFYVNISYRAT